MSRQSGESHVSSSGTAPLPRDARVLAAAFLTSGTTHLVRPQVFEPLIPPRLPAPRAIVLASGVAELVCGLGLLHPRTRRLAGWASAAVLVGVWPGNVQMSLDHARRAQRRRDLASAAMFAGTVARLPMQLPMIRTALRVTRRPARPTL